MQSLQRERNAYDSCTIALAERSAALTRWLADNERKAEMAADPASLLVPADAASAAALAAQAEDLAIGDALSALDRCLHDGRLPLDTYLKQVRAKTAHDNPRSSAFGAVSGRAFIARPLPVGFAAGCI